MDNISQILTPSTPTNIMSSGVKTFLFGARDPSLASRPFRQLTQKRGLFVFVITLSSHPVFLLPSLFLCIPFHLLLSNYPSSPLLILLLSPFCPLSHPSLHLFLYLYHLLLLGCSLIYNSRCALSDLTGRSVRC